MTIHQADAVSVELFEEAKKTVVSAMATRGGRLTGKHHEIYLNAPGRTAPERLGTTIRQPFGG